MAERDPHKVSDAGSSPAPATDLDRLIADLEAAEEGSRELDGRIAAYLGLGGMGFETWEAIEAFARPYTTSLSCARTLIEPGWCYSIHAGYAKPGWNGHQCWATVTTTKDGQWDTPGAKIIEGYGKTEELSVCIAALRAKQAEETSDD